MKISLNLGLFCLLASSVSAPVFADQPVLVRAACVCSTYGMNDQGDLVSSPYVKKGYWVREASPEVADLLRQRGTPKITVTQSELSTRVPAVFKNAMGGVSLSKALSVAKDDCAAADLVDPHSSACSVVVVVGSDVALAGEEPIQHESVLMPTKPVGPIRDITQR